MKLWFILFFFLTSCVSSPTPVQQPLTEVTATASPTRNLVKEGPIISTEPTKLDEEQANIIPVSTNNQVHSPSATEALPTPTSTLELQDWQTLPVIPTLNGKIVDIYLDGLSKGNNPNAFSKIGDCESTPTWFLGDFDLDNSYYNLGPYQSLESVILQFKGSFSRSSLAARRGFKASSALTPLWADRKLCEKNETPLACEYRLHNPFLAFIMLGTNDVYHQDTFESQMREIIEYSIAEGIIPVLATKADNLEGDGSINATIAQLAWEYNIPLWNFWLAVQPLPDQGLQPDGSHLTWAQNFFDEPKVLEYAWPVRNLTALQVLDAIWQELDTATNP